MKTQRKIISKEMQQPKEHLHQHMKTANSGHSIDHFHHQYRKNQTKKKNNIIAQPKKSGCCPRIKKKKKKRCHHYFTVRRLFTKYPGRGRKKERM